jgi:ABC-type amino acid transport substrate-binding protein
VDDSFATPEQVLQALRDHKVSALVMTIGWALLEKRKQPLLELGFLFPPSPGRAWAVRKDAPLLRQALDEYINNVRRTPTWSRLVVKYYGELALEVLKKSSNAP